MVEWLLRGGRCVQCGIRGEEYGCEYAHRNLKKKSVWQRRGLGYLSNIENMPKK